MTLINIDRMYSVDSECIISTEVEIGSNPGLVIRTRLGRVEGYHNVGCSSTDEAYALKKMVDSECGAISIENMKGNE